MSKKTKETILVLLRVAVAMTIFVVAVVNYDELTHVDMRAIVEGSSSILVAILAIWGLYLIKSVLFILPASLIYIYVGMAFSPINAIAINFVGIVIEVIVTYFLGRFLGGDYVNKLLMKNKAGRKLLEKKLNNSFLPLFGVRVLPVFPIDFVSLFLGASKCGFITYISTALLGIMPRVILFTILGDGIYDYIPINLIILVVIILIPIGATAYLIRHFVKQSRAN